MQNDWVKWLFMIKFSENFNIFSIILMTSFYFNKDFHLWMKEFLIFNHQQLKKTKQIIEAQINKHRWDIIYEVKNWVWLFFRNIKTTKSCKNLKDKQLEFYQITVKVEIFYHLCLLISMKQLHLIFSLKLLNSYFNGFLSKKHSKSFKFLTIKDDEHWKINDILNFKCYWDQIQYKVKWTELNQDNKWYYVNKEKFNDFKDVLIKFYKY